MSGQVHRQLQSWINTAGLAEGSRLPSERDLAVQLGVSRTELRKALLVLEVEGLLHRKVGSGTYLNRSPAPSENHAVTLRIGDLAERTGPQEAMIARLAIEPELARMAALNASQRQIRELRGRTTSIRQASTWRAYEQQDSQFHDLIAEASGNSLLHEVHKVVNGVRLIVVWRRLDTPESGPPPDYHSFDEHDAIVSALETRDAAAAHDAMRRHLASTLASMTGDF
ncbi:MAG: FadR/GntR family transcriptional regulator [Geminicoccaceae bacterium]